MSRKNRRAPRRSRVGRVSIYAHHNAWWIYYRENGRPIRHRVSAERADAERLASQINSQLASGTPSLLAFAPLSVDALRQHFLDYHEQVLRSSVATVKRYRTATLHLERFCQRPGGTGMAHQFHAAEFVSYLRSVRVAPNGHPNSMKRTLRDKGVQYILETCRAMYTFAGRNRHLPPYADNPFSVLPITKLKIADAKPVFVFDADSELAFFRAADTWAFVVHFVLAKTALRPGELTHLLIEDVEFDDGWLHVRNKPELGWRVKTGVERRVPLLPEVVAVLRYAIGQRTAGPVVLRPRFFGKTPDLCGSRADLERVSAERLRLAGDTLSRSETLRIARTVWRDAGATKPDAIRNSFIDVMNRCGRSDATCPKSWRHTFATLLQDANVDPLVRQLTLGHRPTTGAGLGMTAHYTHTRPTTLRAQIENALRQWPASLELAACIAKGFHK